MSSKRSVGIANLRTPWCALPFLSAPRPARALLTCLQLAAYNAGYDAGVNLDNDDEVNEFMQDVSRYLEVYARESWYKEADARIVATLAKLRAEAVSKHPSPVAPRPPQSGVSSAQPANPDPAPAEGHTGEQSTPSPALPPADGPGSATEEAGAVLSVHFILSDCESVTNSPFRDLLPWHWDLSAHGPKKVMVKMTKMMR